MHLCFLCCVVLQDQNSPLHYAAYQGHTSICNLLISFGASIDATNGSGCTPVFFATQQGHVEVVNLLLQNLADLHIAEKKNKLTPVDVCSTPAIMTLFRNLPGKPPSIPTAPTLEPLSDTALKVSWSPPCLNLDEVVPVSGYKIKLTSTSEPTKIVHAIAFPTETCLTNLRANADYSASICAINLHGLSDYSAASKVATTKRAKALGPLLSVAAIGSTEVTVMWDLAELDRQSGTTCIIYLTSPELNGTCKWEVVYKTDDLSINCTTVKNLIADHRYKVRAAAISSDNHKTLSDAITIRTSGKAAIKVDV